MSEKPSGDLGSWESGEKRGEGAPARMGDWTRSEDIDPKESELNEGNSDKIDFTDDQGISRRDLLKNMAVASAGIVTLGAVGPKAAERLLEIGERELQEKTEILKQRTVIVTVPVSYGIDNFYQKSGWNTGEGSIDAVTYREIVKNINGLENSSLTAGAKLEVPIREGNALESGN